MLRTRYLIIGSAVVGVAATALVAAVPGLAFAHRNPDLHIALQTAEALIGFFVAFLVFGRFRRRRRLPELLLCLALVVLALSNLLFSATPAIFDDSPGVDSPWASLIARLAGAILFTAAAFAPDRRVRVGAREERRLGIALLAAFAAVWVALQIFESSLPVAVETVPSDPRRPHLEGHWTILSAQLIGCLLYSLAAVGFTRRLERTGDRLLSWLAVGAVLSAVARLNYFLYPSLFSEYVYTGDFFRLAFYLVILVAAVNEIRSYWREAAATAALEERGRIARDLHDGMAQELASIQRNLRWIEGDDEFVRRASESAERALAQARQAILALSSDRGVSVADALADTARAVADREGTRVVVDVTADEVVLAPSDRETLVLIASEAITNAARHANTDHVRVELSGPRPLRLRIRDFGRGFDATGEPRRDGGGMGLQFMKARAEGIGATLQVDSRPGEGTSIEVTL